MDKKDIGKIVGGVILVIVAVWAFVSLANANAKYAGGAILLVVGLALIIMPFVKKKKAAPETPTEGGKENV